MIEVLLVIAIFFGGYEVGHKNSVVSCESSPLVVSSCVGIQPPQDDSFGSTTVSYVSLVGQYRKCKAACTQSVGVTDK